MNTDLSKTITKSALLVRAILVSSILAISLLISSLLLNEFDSILFGLLVTALGSNILVFIVSTYTLFKYSYAPFSFTMKTLARFYLYGTLLIWFLWMPLMTGPGVGQFFFILSGILLYVLPAWLVVHFEQIKWLPSVSFLHPKPEAKAWQAWMKEQPFKRDEMHDSPQE